MTVDDVPNPQATAGSFVQDSADVLGPEYAALIDNISKNLEAKTSAELAVVTIDDLGGITVEDFAVQLFKRFGIGKKGKDNGLLILFARDDKKVRIEVGYGLEGAINDAKSGRLLDTYAIPKFKEGQYARGLYDLAKAAAEEVAKEQGGSLGVADPESWPAQPEIASEPAPEKTPPEIQNAGAAVLIYVAVFLGSAVLGLLILTLRVFTNKARAAKKDALGKGAVIPVLTIFIGAIAMFMIGAAAERVLLPLGGYLGTVFLAMGSQILIRKRLGKYISGYQLVCKKCGTRMEMVDEISDNKFLEVEEVAEEKAGGMDYEFWKCPKCDAVERFNVKLPRADKCPKCNRRSLVMTKTTLVAATTSSSGRERIDHDCKNPKCGHHFEKTRTIPRISSSSGGSGGSSGGSSFGGGSSGGGGSSRGW
jgi:uncharacterized protein